MKPGALISLLLFALACGSAPVKDEKSEDKGAMEQTLDAFDGGEIMPRGYKTIYIHHFENKTYEADVVSRFKEHLQMKFNLDGRLKVETDKKKADVWMYGKIGVFQRIPAEYDRLRRPTRYLMTMIVSVRMRPNTKHAEEMMLQNKEIRYDTSYSPRVPPYETEFVAKERLMGTLADRVVYTVFEGWYSKLKTEAELNQCKSRKKEECERVTGPSSDNILNRVDDPSKKR